MALAKQGALSSLVLACRALRAFAVGVLGVAIPVACEQDSLSTGELQAVLAAGLAGACAQAQLAVFVGRHLERCWVLALFTSILAVAVGLMSLASDARVLAAAALLGAVSVQPNISAQVPVEQTLIAEAVADGHERGRLFAWFNSVSTLGVAAGSLATGFSVAGGARTQLLYTSGLLFVTAVLYILLAPRSAVTQPASPPADLHLMQCRHRGRILGLASLYAVDAFAGGMVMTSILIHWLSRVYALEERVLGPLFAVLGVITVPSLWIAVWLGQRIGLINTMVLTHIPSNICLVLMALTSSETCVCLLLVVRAALSQMDVPCRDHFNVVAVDAEERIACCATVNSVRAVAAVAGPLAGAVLWKQYGHGAPLVVAGLVKCAYDLALFGFFRAVHGATPTSATHADGGGGAEEEGKVAPPYLPPQPPSLTSSAAAQGGMRSAA